jgi:hypothetical protein
VPQECLKNQYLELWVQSFFLWVGTCGADWPEGVFVEGETLTLGVLTHVLVEVAAAGEVEDHAVVLVVRTHPHVQVPECAFALLVTLCLVQVANALMEMCKIKTRCQFDNISIKICRGTKNISIKKIAL